MPKISVIVPVYNTEKYLRKCLDSIVNQSYPDIEIIIVNDGSTDNSQIIIDEYKEKYPKIIKGFIKPNGGLSDARNYGIEKATGDYISFVDSDDYLDEELFTYLKDDIRDNIELIKFKFITVNGKYETIEKIPGPTFENKNGEDAFNLLVFQDKLLEPACIYLYKKEIFVKNKFQFAKGKYHEDFGLIPLLITTCHSVSSKDIYGYYYMQSDNSLTRNVDYNKTYKRALDLLYHYDNLLINMAFFELKKETIQNLKQYYSNSILLATKKLQKKDKKNYLKEIEKREIVKNIHPRNLKQLIKKMILNVSVNIYLKIL